MQHDQHPKEQTNEDPAQNHVTLTGTISRLTMNKNGGQQFVLVVNRLSGQNDRIPVVMSPQVTTCIRDGQQVTVQGMFTSFNEIHGERSKLILQVYATNLREATDDDHFNPNTIEMVGFVCKAPVYRTTPFNREITDLLVAVNRTANKSDYIPAIAWGKNARLAKNLTVGEKIQIIGRVQSREYQKRFQDDSVETRTAYEVSINEIRGES